MESKDDLYSIPESSIQWLLSSQTPSLRYFTRTLLLGCVDDDPSVISTRVQIAQADYVQAIISAQDAEGYWYSKKQYYGPKYRSSHWSMLLLTELGAPPEMPALQKGAQFMIERMENRKDIYYPIESYRDKNTSGFLLLLGQLAALPDLLRKHRPPACPASDRNRQ